MMKIPLSTALLDSLPEPHCVLGSDLVVLSANTSFVALIGVEREVLLGKSARVFWPDIDRTRLVTGEYAVELRPYSGESLSVKLALFSSDVVVIRVLASFSEDRVTKVFHAQRLETLGLLAGGVAHDFNNVLTGILGHVAYLRNVLPQTGLHIESLCAIEEGALRASSISQQIVKFSRSEQTDVSSRVDLVDVVSRICILVKGAIPSGVELRWSAPDEKVCIIAAEAHLSQVVINLVVNARDAVNGSGLVEISVVPSCAASEVEQVFGEEPPSPCYSALSVRDNGQGMTAEIKARLFEPYFTTKKEGGTGLGLATVSSIVKSLGGAVEVTSSPGEGSEFRVYLPSVPVEKAEVSEAAEAGPVRGCGERILVIDDEYAVRNVLALSLTHLGYDVETAAGGLEALDKFAEVDGRFDLVILDLLMPGLSGEEVFLRLRKVAPDVRVLLVSGFSSQAVVQRILDGGGRDFIQKPFSIEVLSKKVRGCLCE